MATPEELAKWIVENQDKVGTPDFEIVSRAFLETQSGNQPAQVGRPPSLPGAAPSPVPIVTPEALQQQEAERRQRYERPVTEAFSEGFMAPRQSDPFGINPENQTILSPLLQVPRAGLEYAESLYSGAKQALGQALYNYDVLPSLRSATGLPQRTGDTPERLAARSMELPEVILEAMPIAPIVSGPQRTAAALARGAGRAEDVVPPIRQAPGVGRVVEEIPEVQPQTAAGVTEDLARTARTATGFGIGSRAARRKLARAAQRDPSAVAAAERLGVELPVDVLTTDSRLRNLSGLLRSQTGSAAETAWAETTRNAIVNANRAFEEMGASSDISRVSSGIRETLEDSANTLKNNANSFRREVNTNINVAGRVDAQNIKNWLQERIDQFGGGEEGLRALTSKERELWDLVSESNPTYARLDQIRDEIGRGLEQNSGPWMDALGRNSSNLYEQISGDQLSYIKNNYGEDLANKQTLANEIFREMYGVRGRMQKLFGRDLSGSIASTLSGVITRGAKGDITALNKIIKNVPEEERATALTSALFNAATRGGAGQVLEGVSETARPFSFASFTSAYRGLKNNSEVYNIFSKELGSDRMRILDDLYTVSRRIADAEGRILRTGKANQLPLEILRSQGFVSKVIQAAASRAAGAAMGALLDPFGGGLGAVAGLKSAEGIQNALSNISGRRLEKLHNLLNSSQFEKLIDDVALGAPTAESERLLLNTQTFRSYLNEIGVPIANGANWLRSALSIEAQKEPPPVQQESRLGAMPQNYAKVLSNMPIQGAPSRNPNDYARILSSFG